MASIIDTPRFRADYEKLKDVTLNPARHTAANAYEHCEQVRARVAHLARLNDCTDAEADILRDLAYLHDIGKITGTARAERSVELLPHYGVDDAQMTALVRFHDTSLGWFKTAQRGEPPGAKAWARIAGQLDMRLLCIFMVADRIDCPGGWRANEPTVWFSAEAERRGYVEGLVFDDGA